MMTEKNDDTTKDPQVASEATASETGSEETRGPTRRHKTLIGVAVFAVALLTVGIALLLVNITERRTEAQDPFFRVAEIDETTVDPEVWGQNFPLHFDLYKRTLEMEEGVHGGSEALPAVLTADDPRAQTTTDQKIELDPRLVDMWKGYAFSIDYREARGHAFMLHDQRVTERVQQFNQPGACLNCHASTTVLMNDLGDGDMMAGFAAMNKMPYGEATELVTHPIACIDCHDPDTMALRITRPAFMEGIAALKEHEEGIKDYDVNRDATPSEMRSFVCGQCHVEYYFKGEEKTLTFPWSKGTTIDDELAYYDEDGHIDWVHEDTGAEMLKAQHPEFELWREGIHAAAGVSCADCHMPYQREGAMKISDHQVRSPMTNINNACLTCHSTSEDEILQRVETIQDRHLHARDVAQNALADLIADLTEARANGATDAQLAEAWQYQRKASFYIDWIVSENSVGFHAPAESQRVLLDATDAARMGQLSLIEALAAG